MSQFLSFAEIQKATAGRWLRIPKKPFELTGGISTDTRTLVPGQAFLAIKGERFDGHDHLVEAAAKGASLLIVSRDGIHPPEGPAALHVNDSVAAYQAIAGIWLSKQAAVKTIAITGSSGKTSCKAILAAILEAAAPKAVVATLDNTNNQIGVPQNIVRVTPETKFVVLELGTNHMGEIKPIAQICPADVAILTGLGDAHAGNFASPAAYASEKAEMLRCLKPGGLAIIARNAVELLENTGALEGKNVLTFGPEEDADIRVSCPSQTLVSTKVNIYLPKDKLLDFPSRLGGLHQAGNIAAAYAAGEFLGAAPAPEKLSTLMANLKLPAHRMKVLDKDGITWIDDSYNANLQSSIAALDWVAECARKEKPKRVFLCLGDMLELGARTAELHEALAEHAAELIFPKDCKVNFVLVGEEIGDAFKDFPAEFFVDAEFAGQSIRPILRRGDWVLLKGSRGMTMEKILEDI